VTTVAWVVEGTWTGCVDAARAWAPAEDDVLLLYVTAAEVAEAAAGALAGLMGRGRAQHSPRVEQLTAQGAADLLAAAVQRLGRPARTEARSGRVEREVVAAAEGARLLVVARDGDRSRLGPRSLGAETRFVVDHAPCPVLLVWPDDVPAVASIPPPPWGQEPTLRP
jgi:nucleotide-binding universal stress UspA family protein